MNVCSAGAGQRRRSALNTKATRTIRCPAPLWVIASLCFAGSVWVSWIGYLGSDDALYAGAALHWLQFGPTIGTTHFSLRLTTFLPVAAAFELFGVREFPLILPTLIAGALSAAVLVTIARHLTPGIRALVAIALLLS